MNLLSQMQALFAENPQGYAKITGVRNDGRLIATLPSRSVVILQGQAEIGKAVFYDRVSNKVLSEAPSVGFNEYGV